MGQKANGVEREGARKREREKHIESDRQLDREKSARNLGYSERAAHGR